MNWKFILIYLIFYLNISNSAHIPTILDNLSPSNAREFIQKMETEFKNLLNVPIVFRFRIVLLACVWAKVPVNTIRFHLLRQIKSADERTALIEKHGNNLAERILNLINSLANYEVLYTKSHQENKLTEFGFMETIEDLLKQLVPMSKENDLPWEQAKNKVFELMRIIKDLEYGETKFSTKVTKKIASILVKIILQLEVTGNKLIRNQYLSLRTKGDQD
ncbi:unnamed protein product [Meloidogyne enterolobii]|uniref:Uncharacterized protein n=1 Tax=Meloidogyne enterolobii TaxID=390850 RepID=A0ACB1B3K6_MELEN